MFKEQYAKRREQKDQENGQHNQPGPTPQKTLPYPSQRGKVIRVVIWSLLLHLPFLSEAHPFLLKIPFLG
jgi:hypothetical protein